MAEHTRFKELVALCQSLEATTKKREKTELIAAFLHRLNVEEISPSVLLILGTIFPEADSRTLNVSESTIRKVVGRLQGHAHTPEPLTILEVHNTFGEIANAAGRGSQQKREVLLESLFCRVTRLEAFQRSLAHLERRWPLPSGPDWPIPGVTSKASMGSDAL